MPYAIQTQDGKTIRVGLPKWLADKKNVQFVNSQQNLSAEQKRDLNAPTLIMNEKQQYKFVPRILADKMIDDYKAIEISQDDPEYDEAKWKALGYPKDHIQIKGEFIHQDKLGVRDFQKQYEEFQAKKKNELSDLQKKRNSTDNRVP